MYVSVHSRSTPDDVEVPANRGNEHGGQTASGHNTRLLQHDGSTKLKDVAALSVMKGHPSGAGISPHAVTYYVRRLFSAGNFNHPSHRRSVRCRQRGRQRSTNARKRAIPPFSSAWPHRARRTEFSFSSTTCGASKSRHRKFRFGFRDTLSRRRQCSGAC